MSCPSEVDALVIGDVHVAHSRLRVFGQQKLLSPLQKGLQGLHWLTLLSQLCRCSSVHFSVPMLPLLELKVSWFGIVNLASSMQCLILTSSDLYPGAHFHGEVMSFHFVVVKLVFSTGCVYMVLQVSTKCA